MNTQAPQVLTIREVTGRIEAILSWIPDSVLRTEAAGTQLHLASHVLDPDGRVLLFDGPRAVPGLGPEGKLCVLPLLVPDVAGRYRIQIEPVVEQRFWGTERGYMPLVLDVERHPDGGLVLGCSTSGCAYILNRKPPFTFSVDSPLYGVGDSERCVEIPWCISRYRGERRVLDVGYANAESRYLEARNVLKIPCLVGLDLAATPHAGIFGVAGDAQAPPFLSGSFDTIFAISVLEHIGRDNSLYFERGQPSQEFGDLEAACQLAALLRPAGRLLVTVPFGRLEDHGWFVQYDLRRIVALLEATGCDLTLAEYYGYRSDGWHGPVDPLTLNDVAYRTGFGAGAVACLELSRRNGAAWNHDVHSYEKSMQAAGATRESSLSSAISPQTAKVLKLSGAWSRMRGETARMRPIMLFCETVNICNADCVFCPYSLQTRPRGFMTAELFESVLAQYRQIGGGYLTLTPMVGDALLDRNWMQRIRLLGGVREWIVPSVTSNLYALDKYSDYEVVEMLKVLRRIHISCYGITPDECEALTRRRAYDRFLSQTRRLLGLRQVSGVDCDVRIGFRLARARSNEDLEAFLRDQLGEVLPFGATITYANWGNSMHGALPREASWVAPRTNESACVMLPLAVQVYWDGRVSACSCCDYDSGDQLYLGDINKQSLEQIFNGPESRAVWRAHGAGELQRICRQCTFHVPLTTLSANHPIAQNPLDFIGG